MVPRILQAYATPTVQILLFASAAISPATGVPWLQEISICLFVSGVSFHWKIFKLIWRHKKLVLFYWNLDTSWSKYKSSAIIYIHWKAWLPFRVVQRSGMISVVETINKVLKIERNHSMYYSNSVAVDCKLSEWFFYYTY